MPTETLLQHRFPSQAEQLKQMREALSRVLMAAAHDEELVNRLVLAVNEACMNVIQHAYAGAEGEMELALFREGDELIFRLTDDAPTIDPDCVKSRCLAEVRPGGLGVHLMHEVMDEVCFLKPVGGTGNLLEMRKGL